MSHTVSNEESGSWMVDLAGRSGKTSRNRRSLAVALLLFIEKLSLSQFEVTMHDKRQETIRKVTAESITTLPKR